MFIAAITLTRGFTMHEHLDQVGLIHMGGRVYDPELGRFLSPDPFVQFPISTQGFNRYAYVNNNPLSYTDPSGYFLKDLMKVVGIGMNFIPGWTLAGNAFEQQGIARGATCTRNASVVRHLVRISNSPPDVDRHGHCKPR